MIPRRIVGCTRVFGAPLDDPEVIGLPVVDTTDADGFPMMVSAWEPTMEEVHRLLAGGSVILRIRGATHPVVSLDVSDA